MHTRWQVRVYSWLWGMLVAAGLAGLLRFRTALGRGFGGFIWQYDNNYGHSVSFEVPRHWPGPQAGLIPHTQIMAINGHPPMQFPTVYAQNPIGAPVIYDVVQQGGQAVQICVPLTRFTPGYLAEGYGMIFVIGMSFSTAGYLLTRSAQDTGRMLMGFIMLTSADSAFYHSHSGNVDRFYNRPIFPALMGAPSNAILGTLLLHLALVYPQPVQIARHVHWLVPTIYSTGMSIGSLYGLSLYYGNIVAFRRLQPALQLSSLMFLAFGTGATIIRGAWELLGNKDHRSTTERRQMRIMAVAWLLSAAVMLGILGAANLRVPLPLDLLTTIGAVLPIGLVYAIYNADLIAELEEQSSLRGELLAQLDEFKRLREQLLEEFADDLHDSALADSKALEMRLYTLLRQTTDGQMEGEALRAALAELHKQGVALGRVLRLTVEGVKPLDLSQETLIDALQILITQLNTVTTGTHYTLHAHGAIAQATPAVQETMYWIARAALNNVRDHAAAATCAVELTCTTELLTLHVRDTGNGMLIPQGVQATHAQRQFGIRAMRARATRLGGQLVVTTTAQGTQVIATLPLHTPGEDDARRTKRLTPLDH